jgi:hypothetical protein
LRNASWATPTSSTYSHGTTTCVCRGN